MQPWTINIPLLPDEIISSWLVRAALTQGCDPLVLTGSVWPKWRIWTIDADRFIENDRLKLLSRLSGISVASFQESTLYPISNQIYGCTPPVMSSWRWILTLGARNTKRNGGMQFCPSCLVSDTKPYYRRQWRLAWHSCCKIHGTSLLDRCTSCGAPIEPHRLLAEDGTIAKCATCKTLLSKESIQPAPPMALAFQNMADQCICDGQGSFLGHMVSSSEWLELASFFESLIRRAHRSSTESLKEFFNQLELELPNDLPVFPGAGIALLRTSERQKIIGLVYALMTADRDKFATALAESGMTLQTFCNKGEILPSQLLDISLKLQDKQIVRVRQAKKKLDGPRSKQEVVRMMASLQRKFEMVRR